MVRSLQFIGPASWNDTLYQKFLRNYFLLYNFISFILVLTLIFTP